MQTRPSRLYLPKFDSAPETIFRYLLARFPQVDAATWRERMSRGAITLSDGTTLNEDSPYRHGVTVFYRKEVRSEPALREDPAVLYRDEEIIVVDKPHGMPVTPSGQHIERSLFIRVQRMTGLPDLTPVHRLDLDTAGLVLFTIKENARAAYSRLFAEGRIQREYLAVGHVNTPPQQASWMVPASSANRKETSVAASHGIDRMSDCRRPVLPHTHKTARSGSASSAPCATACLR